MVNGTIVGASLVSHPEYHIDVAKQPQGTIFARAHSAQRQQGRPITRGNDWCTGAGGGTCASAVRVVGVALASGGSYAVRAAVSRGFVVRGIGSDDPRRTVNHLSAATAPISTRIPFRLIHTKPAEPKSSPATAGYP